MILKTTCMWKQFKHSVADFFSCRNSVNIVQKPYVRMLNVEFKDGQSSESCFSLTQQEGSLSSQETRPSWKEPSSTQSWRRAVVALALRWLEVTSLMSFSRSKVWYWMDLQLWMARWKQVQYMTSIHRGHCFHFKNIHYNTFIHFLFYSFIGLVSMWLLMPWYTLAPFLVHEGLRFPYFESRKFLIALGLIFFKTLCVHLPLGWNFKPCLKLGQCNLFWGKKSTITIGNLAIQVV